MGSQRKFDLEDRIIAFSSRVIDVVEGLPNSRAGNYIAAQLIRCGLAHSLMYGEAQAAESSDDFIHKMKLLAKELKESSACMKLISAKAIIKPISKMEPLKKENEELIAIICKSIETAKRNNQKPGKN